MSTDVTFRRATEADWPGVWRVFRRVVATADTYTYPPDIDEHDAQAAWWHVGEARTITFVAERTGDIVGTALLKPNLPGLGDHVANAGWMIDPDATGQGLGRAFARHVIDEARALGFEAMQFNAVVATNERAIALWRSLGFELVGTIPGGFRRTQSARTDLHVMFRTLS